MLKTGLILLFPLLLLTACGTRPIKVDTQTIKLTPPAELLRQSDVPMLDGNTNKDLLFWSLDLQDRLKQCNGDKQLILEWATK